MTNGQAIFVCKGMLATIDKIHKDCTLTEAADKLAVAKAKSGVLGLITALSGGLTNVD